MVDDNETALQALNHTRFTSYWLDSLEPDRPEPWLDRDIRCDLLVVGGGFCSLWAAIQAKENQSDRSVILIEAKAIANGANGRPAAIMSTSVMHGIDNTERQYPDEVAELEELGKRNMDEFRETVDRYGIDCDEEWGGEMKVSIGDQGLDAVEKEYRLNSKYGHNAVKFDRESVQSEVQTPIFHAGVWSRKRSGTVHPGKLARELKRVAQQLGVETFEFTPMVGHRNRADRVETMTPRATISSSRAFLATNAWAAGHPRIRTRVAAIRDRIVVTEPLTRIQMKAVGWANRQGIYDTRTQLNYMRLTRDNRILFGGRLGYFFGNQTDPNTDRGPEPYLRLINAFYRTFPQLKAKVRFSHAWGGPIGLTTRMAVHYQRFCGGRMIFAGGYSGFGVTASRFGARVGLAILDEDQIPETRMAFARTQPGYIPPEPFYYAVARRLAAAEACRCPFAPFKDTPDRGRQGEPGSRDRRKTTPPPPA